MNRGPSRVQDFHKAWSELFLKQTMVVEHFPGINDNLKSRNAKQAVPSLQDG